MAVVRSDLLVWWALCCLVVYGLTAGLWFEG
jgi:hypothetical protein